MNEDLRRDIVVPIILFVIFGIFTGWIPILFVMTFIPVICYAAAIHGSRKPREVYIGKTSNRSYRSWKAPKYQNHPVVMPRLFYALEAVLCVILGLSTLILFPISFYFFNWSSIYWAMADGRVQPIPTIPNVNQQRRYSQQKQSNYTEHSNKGKNTAEDALHQMGDAMQRFLQSEEVKEAAKTVGSTVAGVVQEVSNGMKNAKSSSATNQKHTSFKKTKPSPEEIAQQLKLDVIRQIETNDAQLQDINQALGEMLETMFGGSKITIAKYQAGMDEAIELSSQNLQAAREYAKTGSNPEVMQKFLDRSNMINKKTNELLDALVTHQHNLMEEDFQDLTGSLEDLQDSLKYYH